LGEATVIRLDLGRERTARMCRKCLWAAHCPCLGNLVRGIGSNPIRHSALFYGVAFNALPRTCKGGRVDISKNCAYAQFCGIPISQWWDDLLLWECFLNRHKIDALVELGTGSGGMSLFLCVLAAHYGFSFTTIDILGHPKLDESPLARLLDIDAYTCDVFSCRAKDIVARLVGSCEKPIALFCDNGKKRREVKEYVPILRDGDFVVVHDWGKEFRPADVLDEMKLVVAHPANIESLTRWFRIEK